MKNSKSICWIKKGVGLFYYNVFSFIIKIFVKEIISKRLVFPKVIVAYKYFEKTLKAINIKQIKL